MHLKSSYSVQSNVIHEPSSTNISLFNTKHKKPSSTNFTPVFEIYKPGWHQVVVVEHFNKGLDFAPLGNLLLAHACCDFTRIAVNACDQSMAVRTVCCAIINVLKTVKRI